MGVEKHDRGNCTRLKITNQRHTEIESELRKERDELLSKSDRYRKKMQFF